MKRGWSKCPTHLLRYAPPPTSYFSLVQLTMPLSFPLLFTILLSLYISYHLSSFPLCISLSLSLFTYITFLFGLSHNGLLFAVLFFSFFTSLHHISSQHPSLPASFHPSPILFLSHPSFGVPWDEVSYITFGYLDALPRPPNPLFLPSFSLPLSLPLPSLLFVSFSAA